MSESLYSFVPRKTIDGKFESLHPLDMQPNMFLEGNFAPVKEELTLSESGNFDIRGKIPKDLNGSFFRNGPNPQFAAAANYHWFFGDGMVHAFHLQKGEVSYRSRFVRTPTWEIERNAGKAVFFGGGFSPLANLQLIGGNILSLISGLIRRGNADVFTKLISKANTSLLSYREHLYALVESSPPFAIDPFTLDSIGFEDFGNRFIAPFTAHPKIDAVTGYLYAFGYRVSGQPKLEYYVINPSGKIVARTPVDLPYHAMVHDFVITRSYAILPVFPAVTSLAAMKRGRIAEWKGEQGACIFVLEKGGNKATIRRFELPACYVYHYANAYEEGKTIVFDGVRYDQVPLMGDDNECRAELFAGKNPGVLTRFRLDLTSGKCSEMPLVGDRPMEFPAIDHRQTGEIYDRLFAATFAGNGAGAGVFNGHVSLSLAKGRVRVESSELPAGHFGGEPAFVPTGKPGTAKGYILNLVYDSTADRSYLAIYDAEKSERRPLCEIGVSARIPYGFHGLWINRKK